MQTFRLLRDFASSDMNYHRYRTEQRKIEQVPCIPLLGEKKIIYICLVKLYMRNTVGIQTIIIIITAFYFSIQ